VGAAYAAGAALQATLVIHTYPFSFYSVYIGWTEIETRLSLAFVETLRSVDYSEVALLVHFEAVQE